MNTLLNHRWRIALVASGAAMLIGGLMHPKADASGSVRQELATMTSHPDWVPAHVLILLSTALLAGGLTAAYRRGAFPTARTALGLAAVAICVYAVETVFHLAAAVDSHALQHGGAAPVAFTHVALRIVLYPVAGLAIANLAWRQVVAGRGPRRLAGLAGVAGGLSYALWVPLTLTLPDVQLSPVSTTAIALLVVWAVGTGMAGFPTAVQAPPQPAAV
jgi:hypothetical protein